MTKSRQDEEFDKFVYKFKKYRRLGIFDSGVGGLSILKYLNEYLDDKQLAANFLQNNKEIIYIADNGRFPYGTKSNNEILTYTEQIIRWLEQREVDLIIFGCNTASAIASKQVSKMTALPVLDLIEPVARYVSRLGLKAGILATQATIQSHAFSVAIKRYAPLLEVQEIASAQLVNIVENGDIASKETENLISGYIDQFLSNDTQIIVLACTHFSFLQNSIVRLVNGRMQIFDPAQLIAQMLTAPHQDDDHLTRKSISSTCVTKTTFFVTGNVETFANTASKCLGYSLKNVNPLLLGDLESLSHR